RAEPDLLVANLHASSFPGHPEIPHAELGRAVAAVLGRAVPGDVVVLGGDLNIAAERACVEGFSAPGPGIDHVLVRGSQASPPHAWPGERRRQGGMLLSDHAPIEVEL